MKIRGQIYSQEASSLLRDISMYQVLLEGQLLRLYPGKESVVRNLLPYLRKQGRIGYEDGLYFMAPGKPDSIDCGLLAHVMGQPGEEPPHYLVLVDRPEQIEELELPHTCGYCTVAPNGEVQYYQKE